MPDASSWRKMVRRRTEGTLRDRRRSARTWPGPTEGSWSASPTSTRRVAPCTASRSARSRSVSTIDTSSTTTTPARRGCSALRWKAPSLGEKASSRCSVDAAWPVASLIRRAARPVGAASRTFSPRAESTSSRTWRQVVLPVPGPPVRIASGVVAIRSTASRWVASSRIRLARSERVISSAPTGAGRCPWPAIRRARSAAQARSASSRAATATESPSTAMCPVPSSSSQAVSSRVTSMPSSRAALPIRSWRGALVWPSSASWDRAWSRPARARRGLSTGIPKERAISSARRNPMPATSLARRYGFSLSTAIARAP